MQDDAEGGEDEDDDEEDMLAAALSEIIEQDGVFSLDDMGHAAAKVENFESDDDDLIDKELDRAEHEAAESVVDEHMKTVIKTATAGNELSVDEKMVHDLLDDPLCQLTPEEAAVEVSLNGVAALGNWEPSAASAGDGDDAEGALLDGDHAADCFKRWSDGARAGLDVLSHRAEALKVMATGHKGELSLIAVVADEAEPHVEYVHWVDPTTMFGRRAYLDDLHRVKYVVPSPEGCAPLAALSRLRDCASCSGCKSEASKGRWPSGGQG